MTVVRGLFIAQRYSAMLLAPFVLIHLALIIIAVRNGLTAEEILSRTNGSTLWFVFYVAFVLAVTVHAPIGVRNVLNEWTRLSGGVVNVICLCLALLMLSTGLRAVFAVT